MVSRAARGSRFQISDLDDAPGEPRPQVRRLRFISPFSLEPLYRAVASCPKSWFAKAIQIDPAGPGTAAILDLARALSHGA